MEKPGNIICRIEHHLRYECVCKINKRNLVRCVRNEEQMGTNTTEFSRHLTTHNYSTYSHKTLSRHKRSHSTDLKLPPLISFYLKSSVLTWHTLIIQTIIVKIQNMNTVTVKRSFNSLQHKTMCAPRTFTFKFGFNSLIPRNIGTIINHLLTSRLLYVSPRYGTFHVNH